MTSATSDRTTSHASYVQKDAQQDGADTLRAERVLHLR